MFSVFYQVVRNKKNIDGNEEVNFGLFACFECRVSKKKCDRKLPSCSRCNKCKLTCKPYERIVKYSKLPSAVTKSTQGDFNSLSIHKIEERCKNNGYNMVLSSLMLNNYSSISSDISSNFNSKDYSKLMSLLSLSSDVVVLKPYDDSNIYTNLAIVEHDPTLSPSFWDALLKLYFTGRHLLHPLFSLQYYNLRNEHWIRTNIIYCIAYEFSDIKSPIANIKMANLLFISEYYLNLNPPCLLNIQCYILLYILYRGIGNIKRKRICLYKAMKTSYLIGLTKKCKGISLKCEYERYLCYAKLIELYWGNGSYIAEMGLTLDSACFWPKFSPDWQLIDPINSTEEDRAVANNISLNTRFNYLIQIHISTPFVKLAKNPKIYTSDIIKLELELDTIYTNIRKKLKIGPYLSNISNHINIHYLLVKLQFNSILLKEINSTKLQDNYLKLVSDIITEYSRSNTKLAGYPIVIHMALQSIIKLQRLLGKSNFCKVENLISIMTNITNYSKDYKILCAD